MAILAVITAVVGIISTLLIAVGSGIVVPAALLQAFHYGFTLLGAGINFLYVMLPAEFWQFCGTALTVIIAAHAAYFAYSVGLSLWRIYQGGGE